MESKTVFKLNEDACGTSLMGYIIISYKHLVDVLGEPHELEGDKTKAEWSFIAPNFINGEDVKFTVYDWKNYTAKENITEWHIGGDNATAVEVIKTLFPNQVIYNHRF